MYVQWIKMNAFVLFCRTAPWCGWTLKYCRVWRSPSKTWVRVCDEELDNGQEWYSSTTHEDTREDTWHLPIALNWEGISDEVKMGTVRKNVGENLVSCMQESLLSKADELGLYFMNSSVKVNMETLWKDKTYWTLHVKKLLGF